MLTVGSSLERTYHEMTAIPRNALMQLNTKATIPLVVNPAGSGLGLLTAPVRSSRSTVLPAALPCVDVLEARQACQWSSGIERVFCSSVGASIMVAMRPLAVCLYNGSQQRHSEEETPDQRRGQRDVHSPFYVTVKQPDARVIGFESDGHVSIWSHQDGISPHRHVWQGNIVSVRTDFFLRACHRLEVVPM